jgi:membrane-associated phospholipid phosphatase
MFVKPGIYTIEYAIDMFGFFSPLIMFAYGSYILRNYPPYVISYIAGYVANFLINLVLKQWIREPRPANSVSTINKYELIGPHEYGMPSAHTQSAFYTVVFLFMMFRSYKLLAFTLAASFITFYQRYKYRCHSISQLLAGTVIGSAIGYIVYVIAYEYIH